MSTQTSSRFHASPIGGGDVARSSVGRGSEKIHTMGFDIRTGMSCEHGW